MAVLTPAAPAGWPALAGRWARLPRRSREILRVARVHRLHLVAAELGPGRDGDVGDG